MFPSRSAGVAASSPFQFSRGHFELCAATFTFLRQPLITCLLACPMLSSCHLGCSLLRMAYSSQCLCVLSVHLSSLSPAGSDLLFHWPMCPKHWLSPWKSAGSGWLSWSCQRVALSWTARPASLCCRPRPLLASHQSHLHSTSSSHCVCVFESLFSGYGVVHETTLGSWQASQTAELAAFSRVHCTHAHCSPGTLAGVAEGVWPGEPLATATSCSKVDQCSLRRQASAPALSPTRMALQRLGMWS